MRKEEEGMSGAVPEEGEAEGRQAEGI